MTMRWFKRLGLAGGLGLLMLGVAGWLLSTWLPGQRQAVDELGSQARRARHALLAQASDPAASQAQVISSPEQAWQTLWQGLPSAEQRVPLQTAVLRAAQDHGLTISSVQYRGARVPWSAQAGAVLWRQRMVMPVEGPYPAVRAWLASMLTEPALSLDELDVQRTDVMGEQVKARVAVSLWWRKPEGGRP
jgi:hypothetical protein